MPIVVEGDGSLYLPTRADPAINQFFENALPCPECEADPAQPLASAECRARSALRRHVRLRAYRRRRSSVADAITTWKRQARAQRTRDPSAEPC